MVHTVKQGDYFSKIAKQYGFGDWKTVWNDAQNAELKKKRQNPNVLLPGDVVVIPDKKIKHELIATEQRHRFSVRFLRLRLRIRLLGLDSKPAAGVNVDITIDGSITPVTTSGKGEVEELLSPEAHKGLIQFKDERMVFEQQISIEVRVGHLDPIEENSGQRGRLNALGYDAGDPAQVGDPNLAFRSAVEEFQCDQGLTVDGIVGPRTRKKLQDVYGC